jgi:hypothetical protein
VVVFLAPRFFEVLIIFNRYFVFNYDGVGICIFLAFLVFVIGVPGWYLWASKIPEDVFLEKTSGVLVVKRFGKNISDGVRESSGEEVYFSCGSDGGCIPRERRKELIGKSAEVWWFYMPSHVFGSKQRLAVRIFVGEEEVLTRSVAEINLKNARYGFLVAGFFVAFFVALARFLRMI